MGAASGACTGPIRPTSLSTRPASVFPVEQRADDKRVPYSPAPLWTRRGVHDVSWTTYLDLLQRMNQLRPSVRDGRSIWAFRWAFAKDKKQNNNNNKNTYSKETPQ